jgi:hypothetical protein
VVTINYLAKLIYRRPTIVNILEAQKKHISDGFIYIEKGARVSPT